MPRFAHRRLIVFLALLCQVLTGSIVHVSTAHALPAAPPAIEASDCPDHAVPNAAGTSEGSAMSEHGHDHAGGSCSSGSCNCSCAHVPAMPIAAHSAASLKPHPPLPLARMAAHACEPCAVFFRPPI